MGPEEGLLALFSGVKSAAAFAGRSLSFGGIAASFGKGLSANIRSFLRSFRQGADEAAEAATKNTPCPPRGSNPGVIKNNPANKKIETGIPRKNGGWVERWVRMSDEDYARWLQERFDYYNRVVELSKRLRLTPEEATRFRFHQMQKWRENWLRDFLDNRTY
jgi:NADH:ubiquinone oxidoreductase subunit D